MRRITTFITLAVALLPMLANGQTKKTFAFVERDSTLWLDVWTPEHPRADRACVVALFGGGFVHGTRDNELQSTIGRMLSERGYVVVSPDYRLGLKDSVMMARYGNARGVMTLFQWVIDIATEDCAAACAWVVEHADEIGVDPQRVVLTGSSAGAIAVLQTDYCRANSMPQASTLPQGWKPAAVVPYSGAIMGKGKPHYATPPAPTMFMHGTKDRVVAYKRFPRLTSHALRGADEVSKAFRRAGYPHWIVRFEGIGHEVASFLPGSVDLFCGFIEQVLAGRETTLDATMTDSRLKPTEWTNMTVIDLYK